MQKYWESNILLSKCSCRAIHLCLAVIVFSDFIKQPYSCSIRPFIYFILWCHCLFIDLFCGFWGSSVCGEVHNFSKWKIFFPPLFSFHHLLFCNEILVILGVWFCYLRICLLINKSCTVKGTFFLNHDFLGIYILSSHHVCFVYLMMLFQLCSSE